jgi:hypothetical protein
VLPYRVLLSDEEVSVIAFTPLGYPAEVPAVRPRKDMKDIVSYDKY